MYFLKQNADIPKLSIPISALDRAGSHALHQGLLSDEDKQCSRNCGKRDSRCHIPPFDCIAGNKEGCADCSGDGFFESKDPAEKILIPAGDKSQNSGGADSRKQNRDQNLSQNLKCVCPVNRGSFLDFLKILKVVFVSYY